MADIYVGTESGVKQVSGGNAGIFPVGKVVLIANGSGSINMSRNELKNKTFIDINFTCNNYDTGYYSCTVRCFDGCGNCSNVDDRYVCAMYDASNGSIKTGAYSSFKYTITAFYYE